MPLLFANPIDYKHISRVSTSDRKIHPKDHHLASQGLSCNEILASQGLPCDDKW